MIDPHQEPVFGQVNRFMSVVREEDDRGLVLSVGAFAEESLGRLLLAYLREGKAASDLLDGFNAPLGTLSARIKAAYAVGLLSEQQFADLEHARRIRNEFAHNWEGCSFESAQIKAWVGQLGPSRIDTKIPDSPREKFRSAMTCVLVELEYLRSTLGPNGRRVPTVASHLSLQPPKHVA